MTEQHLPTDPADLHPKAISRLVMHAFDVTYGNRSEGLPALVEDLRSELQRIVAGTEARGDAEIASRACRTYGTACALSTIAGNHTEDEGWDFLLDRIDDLNGTVDSLLELLDDSLSRDDLAGTATRHLDQLLEASDAELADDQQGIDMLLFFVAANLVTLAVARKSQ